MTCKDCLYVKVCDNLIAHGLPFEDGKYPAEEFCDLYKSSADVEEVVRCKDCKHWCHETAGMIEHYECSVFCDCHGIGYLTGADDFCSYGERKAE